MDEFLDVVSPGYIIQRSININDTSPLVVKFSSLIFLHVGVVVEVRERNLEGIMIFHYTQKKGIWSCVTENMQDFMGDNETFSYYVRDAPFDIKERAEHMVLWGPRSISYSLFANCEDMMNALMTGNAYSPQRITAFILIASLVIFAGILFT